MELLILNEWQQWAREKRLKALLIFGVVIGAVALWHQLDYQADLLETRQNAQQSSRREWLAQEAKHPHMAAHFGNYAYKKPSPLHSFDPGLTPYTGSSVYMEPHRQNDFLFSQSQENGTGLRFGWLSPALVCQLVFPLLIILFAFNAINGEQERGTLPLLLAQGVSFRKIVFAKILATFLVFELGFTVFLATTLVVSRGFTATAVPMLTMLYIWSIYSLYLFIWSLLGVAVSARFRRVGGSIVALLLLWMFTAILMPRLAANVAENLFPLVTNYEFKVQISKAIENGLDGHDPKSDRAKRLVQKLLTQYKVSKVEDLPFNFEGHVMQQGEEYSSQAYDTEFTKLFATLERQKQVQSWLSVLSPFMAVRSLSMAGCGSSMESEIDFQQQAEHFRRSFVQDMNRDMRDNSAYGTFETYRLKPGKYAAMPDLQVLARPLFWSLARVVPEHVWLAGWVLALLGLVLSLNEKKLYAR